MEGRGEREEKREFALLVNQQKQFAKFATKSYPIFYGL